MNCVDDKSFLAYVVISIRLCMGMERMMEKRAKIEHTYALRMESWSNKCRNAYDSGLFS